MEDSSNGSIAIFGISFNWNLENKAARQDIVGARFEDLSWQAEERLISKAGVARELEVTYMSLKGSRRQIQLRSNQIRSLKRQQDAENQKLRQARTDDLAVFKYEIEIQMAELEKVEALTNKMIFLSQIRTIAPDYPRSALVLK